MYSYFKGELTFAQPSHIILEVNGIGFKIYIPANVFTQLPQLGSLLSIHTSYVVRDFSQSLYGFISSNERDLFELLMTVTGIGPKIALSLIGHLPMHDFQSAINNHDIASISKVPGIGKKTAERLIVELRDKIVGLPLPISNITIPSDFPSQTIQDAMSALIHLGYNQLTAEKAIKKTLKDFPDGVDLPKLITLSLNNV